jgi:hypothetical protein
MNYNFELVTCSTRRIRQQENIITIDIFIILLVLCTRSYTLSNTNNSQGEVMLYVPTHEV